MVAQGKQEKELQELKRKRKEQEDFILKLKVLRAKAETQERQFRETLEKESVQTLRARAVARQIDMSGVFEKSDIVELILQCSSQRDGVEQLEALQAKLHVHLNGVDTTG